MKEGVDMANTTFGKFTLLHLQEAKKNAEKGYMLINIVQSPQGVYRGYSTTVH